MLRVLATVLAGLVASIAPAMAQTCSGGLPYSFTSGTTISAAQMNANFTYITSCFANLGANTFTGAQTLPANPTSALQAATKQYVDNNGGGLVRSYLAGLGLSTAGSSTSFAVALGQAADGANSLMITLGSALTKTTAPWAVGNNQGGLDTGSIAASTWYHVYLIERTDTSVVDVLFSLSATSPTLPTNYTKSRRIGSMKTDGSSNWTAFTQLGDEFLWKVPVVDVSGLSVPTTASTQTLGNVPTGVQVTALLGALFNVNSGANNPILITSLDTTDTAPGTSGPANLTATNNAETAAPASVRTNSSAQIRIRASTTNATAWLTTMGWIDRRGRDN